MKMNGLQIRERMKILETPAHDSTFRGTRVHWRQGQKQVWFLDQNLELKRSFRDLA